jgi:hypothetical protein
VVRKQRWLSPSCFGAFAIVVTAGGGSLARRTAMSNATFGAMSSIPADQKSAARDTFVEPPRQRLETAELNDAAEVRQTAAISSRFASKV